MLSFNSIHFRLYRTNLTPLKLSRIFFFVNTLLKVIQKIGRKVSFLTYVTKYYNQVLVLVQYAYVRGLKQPILSSYNRYIEGNNLLFLVVLVELITIIALITVCNKQIVRAFVYASKCFNYFTLSLFIFQLLALVLIFYL